VSALLTIIIVNYRVYHHLDHCLASIQRSGHSFQIDIVVVDNEFSPEDQALLAAKYPAVQWLSEATNIGFAKANNRALQLVNTDYVLFLNPDTLLTPDQNGIVVTFQLTQSICSKKNGENRLISIENLV
jgi:GT2 family glycosyltransferase